MVLHRNPNIRHFATDEAQLVHAGEDDVRTEVDVLALNCFNHSKWASTAAILQDHSKLDDTAHFFKRLHIYSFGGMTQRYLEDLNLSNQIEKLYMNGDFTGSLSLNNLKEIRVQCLESIDLESAIVRGNPNLERVSLFYARLPDISAFIRGSPKLNKLRIEWFHHEVPLL